MLMYFKFSAISVNEALCSHLRIRLHRILIQIFDYIEYQHVYFSFYLLIVNGGPSGHKSHNRVLTLCVALRLVEFT